MAHSVTMKESKHKITNRDVVFVIRNGRKKIGELKISKGNLQWITSNGRTINQVSWNDFNEFMTKGGDWI